MEISAVADEPVVFAGEEESPPNFLSESVLALDSMDDPEAAEDGGREAPGGEEASEDPSSSAAVSESAPGEGDTEQGPDPDAPFSVGDIVLGRTLWFHDRGSKVLLLDYEGIEGFVPRREYPYRLLDPDFMSLPKPNSMLPGMVREYKIINIPPKLIPNRMGPLLSARELDRDLMMQRMVQLLDVTREEREVSTAHVFATNKGGLKVVMGGSACFIPKSQILEDDVKDLSEQELEERYIGRDLECTPIQVMPEEQRVVLSMKRAKQYNTLRQLRPGYLVWGTVRKIFTWGVFIGIDGTYESALIHRSNMTKGRFTRVEDIFEIGDRVCAVVLGLEEDFSRISCSTADLEEHPGDMLRDRQYVFDHAEEQVQRIQHMFEEQDAEVYADVQDLQEYAS